MRLFALAFVAELLICGIANVNADESPASNTARSELIEVGKRVEQSISELRKGLESVDTKADFNPYIEMSRKNSPMAIHGEQLISLARKHAGTPEAICALAHVIAYADNDPGDPAFRYAAKAVEALGNSELHNEHFPAATRDLIGSISPGVEATLRRVSQQSRSRVARAAATQALVERLHAFSRLARWINDEPVGWNREWVKDSYRPAVRKALANREPEELIKEAIELAERVHKEYGELKQPEIRYSGPERIVRELGDGDKPQTYGDLADAFLFEMRRLQVGQQVPDIAGKDSQDHEFRLSDYRKKVVVLTFSADWCGPCVAAYPRNRKLVETYKNRSFALLSVVADEEPRTVDEAITKGDITWRCWYDGMDGPIARRWNVRGWPTIYVIDALGIIRHYEPDGEKLPDLVEALLRKAEERN